MIEMHCFTNGQDRLKGIDLYDFEYDALGNPTTYKGNPFVWTQGRKLASGTLNENSFAYSYDGNGMRYKKTVNGKTTEYYMDGSRIWMENRIGDGGKIYYVYDASGVAGMIYQGTRYFFEKNTLGDIVAIWDSAGNLMGRYSYDAWGNITYQSGSIASVNPFRYRGYYYDTETGFYYLQTRYYDPTICRFINADNYELVAKLSQTVGQLNLYAYANNNPIMLTDETGEFAITTLVLCGIALLGMGLTIAGVASNNNVVTAIGLTMVAIPAIISGVGAIATGATYLSLIGGTTVAAGIGTGLFASAECQEAFTGNNWMISIGMSETCYNGLMLATATIATVGTISCGVLGYLGKMATPSQMINSFNNNPNNWKLVKQIIEPARGKFKGGVSTYSNYINRWTGSKLGIHQILKGARFLHGPHFHWWI